jgi:hypothetical protein
MKENESIWINSDGTYNTNIKGEWNGIYTY